MNLALDIHMAILECPSFPKELSPDFTLLSLLFALTTMFFPFL